MSTAYAATPAAPQSRPSTGTTRQGARGTPKPDHSVDAATSPPCPNRACPNGDARAVAPLGDNFRCGRCGAVFHLGQSPSKPKILVFGPLWEAELRKLVADPRQSLRAIAGTLGVIPMTVKRRAVEFGCPRTGWQSTVSAKTQRRREGVRKTQERHRRTWLLLRALHPDESLQELARRAPATRKYLARSDRDWLNDHRPPPAPPRPRPAQVDWAARDAETFDVVRAAVDGLLGQPGRPVRITRGAVVRITGRTTLLQQLPHLPRTRDYLDTVCETTEAFHRRKPR